MNSDHNSLYLTTVATVVSMGRKNKGDGGCVKKQEGETPNIYAHVHVTPMHTHTHTQKHTPFLPLSHTVSKCKEESPVIDLGRGAVRACCDERPLVGV